MGRYHSHALRQGRQSLAGHCYLVTIAARDRQPRFAEFQHAACACSSFYADSVARHANTLAFVVMPDHVHWLLQVNGNLSEAVRVYKARVSCLLGERIWQDGFHDRGVRREEDLRPIARYIVANPLRGGLVDNILDYPYWNAAWL
ncbi:transposase [Halomonas sp. BM-2019]|uniref:REP-associated tyrosine transposase n=1 Tax=Halomonas sp. BM-2019 TaxID=2811227 RepID=UPI001B3C237B|nr:MAG: transposase [Halomonas sp. BM-2019]